MRRLRGEGRTERPSLEHRRNLGGDAAAEEAQTITDGQGSAAYKRQLVRVYVRRALSAALIRTPH